jgi:hypothetical protein
MEANERFVAFTSSDTTAIVGGVSAAGAAVAGNAWVTLDFGAVSDVLPTADRRKKVFLHRVHVLRATGASGTAHIALVGDVTGAAATAWSNQYESASVAAATRLNETGIDEPMYTDATGKLFFTSGGDAADTFDYQVWFRVVL